MEGGVFRQVRLDLGNARPGPILQPGFVQVVFDAMETAFAHALTIGTRVGRCHGPNGSFAMSRDPYASTRSVKVSRRESARRRRSAGSRGARADSRGTRRGDACLGRRR